MSNKRYIEINSSYRDRTIWPDPAEFELNIAEGGSKGKLTAKDPVCNSMVVDSWRSNAFNAAGGATIAVSAVTTNPIVNANGNQILIVEFEDVPIQQQENYYVGAVVFDDTASKNRRRILEYKYLGSYGTTFYRAQLVLESALPEVIDYPITITDPTDLTISSYLLIFVPDGRESNNAYANMIMYNETKGTSAPIIDYNGTTRIATVNGSSLSVAWALTDAYSIRAVKSAFTIAFNNTTDTASIINFPSTAGGNYQGDFLRVSNSASTTPIVAPINETRRISKYLELNTLFIAPSPGGTSSFKLASGSAVDNYYVGGWLHAIAGGPYQVLTYDGATKTGTITGGPFDAGVIVGTTAIMRTAVVSPAFSVAPSPSQVLELLPFTRDNYNSISYSGSMDSQQSNVCYEVELLNVTLPNRILDSGYGSRISFYPYLYVEFYNVSSPDRNILWSNNPNSARMLFRVPVDDIPNLVTSSFIKLDSDCCVQTVKFRPNDSIHFAVRLGNGELFRTVLDEDFSPSEPNALIQVSAIFEIKRVAPA